jgi:hypothetical protein
MKKEKMDKSIFMTNDKGPHDLPESCQSCYGFSNWDGPKEVLYEDRDCSECSNKPAK